MNHAKALASRILRWHGEAALPSLPWRGIHDPYSTLMAVIMLQRTTREHASRVFTAFLARYSSADTLSQADEAELRELLRPLGLVSQTSDHAQAALPA